MNIFRYMQENRKTVITAVINGSYRYIAKSLTKEYDAIVEEIKVHNKHYDRKGLTEDMIELRLIVHTDSGTYEDVFPKGAISNLTITEQRDTMPIYMMGDTDPRTFQRNRRKYCLSFTSDRHSPFAKEFFMNGRGIMFCSDCYT